MQGMNNAKVSKVCSPVKGKQNKTKEGKKLKLARTFVFL
jgi:hypothetical protein